MNRFILSLIFGIITIIRVQGFDDVFPEVDPQVTRIGEDSVEVMADIPEYGWRVLPHPLPRMPASSQ